MFRCQAPAVLAGTYLTLFPLTAHSQQRPTTRELLLGVRTTLTTVEAALVDFNRDLSRIGPETVLARAAALRTRCAGAEQVVARARPKIRASAPDPQRRRDAASLAGTMTRLDQALGQDCFRGFREDGPGMWADSLRAWGPHRTKVIREIIRYYGAAADKFAAAEGFKLEP
jgi:hypothetical protein